MPELFAKLKSEGEKRNALKESLIKDQKVFGMGFNREISMMTTRINDMSYVETKLNLLDERIDTV